MVKIAKIRPTQNLLNCQNCGQVFHSHKIEKIYQNLYPVCSDKCEFIVLMRIIEGYSQNYFLDLQIVLDIQDYCEIPKKSFIFRVTKLVFRRFYRR